MRTAVKKVVQAPTTEAATAALPEAMKRLDKAAKQHVIHPNTAAAFAEVSMRPICST